MQRGCDGAKRLSGRKRFVICDTLGLWLDVVVLPASVPERAGAEEAFWQLAGSGNWQGKRCASHWRRSGLMAALKASSGRTPPATVRLDHRDRQAIVKRSDEIVKRSDEMQGFEVRPRRWVVERSFGWMNWYRRLSKDYEGHTHLSRAWLLWAMTDLSYDRQDATHLASQAPVIRSCHYAIRGQTLIRGN